MAKRAIAPRFVGEKENGIPMILQAIHAVDFARNSVELTPMAFGNRGKRVCRIESKHNCLVRHSSKTRPVPFNVFQITAIRISLCENLSLVSTGKCRPSSSLAQSKWICALIEKQGHRYDPKNGERYQCWCQLAKALSDGSVNQR